MNNAQYFSFIKLQVGSKDINTFESLFNPGTQISISKSKNREAVNNFHLTINS